MNGMPDLLVVDDNPGDVALIEEMVAQAFPGQTSISSAGTLGEAFGRLRLDANTLILLDLALPDSFGAATYRAVRRLAPDAMVVVLSGNTDESLALELVREGAQDYLVKGQFDAGDLKRVVRYGWERSAIGRELRNQKAWWEAVIQAIPDGLVISDFERRILFGNPFALRIIDRKIEEVVGMDLLDLHPAEVRAVAAADLDALRNGRASDERPFVRALPVSTADGRQVPCELSHSLFQGHEGPRVLTVIRDVSERRRLEQQLLQTQKMEAIGHLTAGIAHDFNNLLAVALGNLDLLTRQVAATPDLAKRVETAKGAVLRGAGLTKKLLSFSKAKELDPRAVSLKETMQGFLEIAARSIGPAIAVETDIPDGLPEVFVDQGELENVLLNLTVNARDAMPQGGRIIYAAKPVAIGEADVHVSAERLPPGGYIMLTVTDTGCGMSKETIERAFEPFFTTKEAGKGTGLGLSMVYGFARQSGGSARIYSELGIGTAVCLHLPVAVRNRPLPDDPAPSDRHMPGRGAKALVVDDEQALVEVALQYLRDIGYAVATATSGAEALALFRTEGPFELLMTDVLMPGGMDGFELAGMARAIDPSVKVLYVSGFHAKEFSGDRLEGNSVLLQKPYVGDTLNAALRRLFRTPA